MVSPLLSIFLMGLVPVWGLQGKEPVDLREMHVAAPIARAANAEEHRVLERRLSASGAIVVDLDSGQTVFSLNADVTRPMASLTKLMSALLIVENHDLEEVVTIPRDIPDVTGNVVQLPPGDQFTVGDLLSALLIMSANDAAVTLARYHSGSLSAFVNEMNARAEELGLRHTVYANPTGLDADAQQSTPRDLAWLSMYVFRHPALAERMSTRGLTIESRKGIKIYLTHTHALLHADTAVIAGKTGTTDAAGQCLLSIVRRAQRRYVVILLRSLDRYADMRTVLDMFSD